MPRFFAFSYPNGTMRQLGNHLFKATTDAELYYAPQRPAKHLGIDAVIIPTARPLALSWKALGRTLCLCRQYNLPVVILSSKFSHIPELLERAEQERVQATIIDWDQVTGFVRRPELKTDELTYLYLSDVADKRNFGLLLGRAMGWQSIMFLDDDIILTAEQLERAADLSRNGAPMAGFNARTFSDHSVVVRADNDITRSRLDSFISANALVVRLDAEPMSFFPNIYCEDWLFMIARMVSRQALTWAGSSYQLPYRPYSKKRAFVEEPGDIIAEGLMRLVTGLLETGREPISQQQLIDTIRSQATTQFWEHEILHRSVMTRELMQRTSRASLRALARRRALATSYKRMVGDDDEAGLSAADITLWVNNWLDDLTVWDEFWRAVAPKRTLDDALGSLGVSPSGYVQAAVGDAAKLTPKRVNGSNDTDLWQQIPRAARTTQHRQGLVSTWNLIRYMQQNRLGFVDVHRAARYLRWDRPLYYPMARDITLTILMTVEQSESQDAVVASVRAIARQYKGSVPINFVLWVYTRDAGQSDSAGTFRELAVSQILDAVKGTQINVLSCVSPVSPFRDSPHNPSAMNTIALAYWKKGIELVGHSFHCINSRNEVFSTGTLTDYRFNWLDDPVDMEAALRHTPGLDRKANYYEPTSDKQAAYVNRQRIIQRSTAQDTADLSATKQLDFYVRRSGLTWLQLDDMSNSFVYHNADAIPDDQSVLKTVRTYVAVLVHAEDTLTKVIGMAEKAVRTSQKRSYPSGVGIAVIFTGDANRQLAMERRHGIMKTLQQTLPIPPQLALFSYIFDVPLPASSLPIQLPLNTLMVYGHWLENSDAKLDIRW